jgi:hypothetical protein
MQAGAAEMRTDETSKREKALVSSRVYLASFRNRELIATMTVLADISTAPAAGVSMMPNG